MRILLCDDHRLPQRAGVDDRRPCLAQLEGDVLVPIRLALGAEPPLDDDSLFEAAGADSLEPEAAPAGSFAAGTSVPAC